APDFGSTAFGIGRAICWPGNPLSAALGWLSGETGANRILAGPSQPSARSLSLYPRGRIVADRASGTLSEPSSNRRTLQPRSDEWVRTSKCVLLEIPRSKSQGSTKLPSSKKNSKSTVAYATQHIAALQELRHSFVIRHSCFVIQRHPRPPFK